MIFHPQDKKLHFRPQEGEKKILPVFGEDKKSKFLSIHEKKER
jgi:hypothetical protein